jgi:hypothetical protein
MTSSSSPVDIGISNFRCQAISSGLWSSERLTLLLPLARIPFSLLDHVGRVYHSCSPSQPLLPLQLETSIVSLTFHHHYRSSCPRKRKLLQRKPPQRKPPQRKPPRRKRSPIKRHPRSRRRLLWRIEEAGGDLDRHWPPRTTTSASRLSHSSPRRAYLQLQMLPRPSRQTQHGQTMSVGYVSGRPENLPVRFPVHPCSRFPAIPSSPASSDPLHTPSDRFQRQDLETGRSCRRLGA